MCAQADGRRKSDDRLRAPAGQRPLAADPRLGARERDRRHRSQGDRIEVRKDRSACGIARRHRLGDCDLFRRTRASGRKGRALGSTQTLHQPDETHLGRNARRQNGHRTVCVCRNDPGIAGDVRGLCRPGGQCGARRRGYCTCNRLDTCRRVDVGGRAIDLADCALSVRFPGASAAAV